jgi:hypothetical protein
VVSKTKMTLLVIPILLASLLVPVSNAQQEPKSTKVVQLTGLVGVKDNTKGNLTIENGGLHFTHSGSVSDLTPGSVQDVVTGSDSQRVIRGTLGTLSMFGPYGSDRFLSLFRTKLDTLTIQYLDADGALHGAIFTMSVGAAGPIKDQLIALGAHTSIPSQGDPPVDASSPSDMGEHPSQEQGKGAAKISASAIRVMMIQSDEIKLPAEFQVSLYENLIQQLQKKRGLPHVYREGDRNAPDGPNLIVIHSTVRGFKQGSQMARQVTTVTGQTSISVHCDFTDKDGKILLERDVKGKVLIFGANLKATYDFAKKAASVTVKNFSPAAGS